MKAISKMIHSRLNGEMTAACCFFVSPSLWKPLLTFCTCCHALIRVRRHMMTCVIKSSFGRCYLAIGGPFESGGTQVLVFDVADEESISVNLEGVLQRAGKLFTYIDCY